MALHSVYHPPTRKQIENEILDRPTIPNEMNNSARSKKTRKKLLYVQMGGQTQTMTTFLVFHCSLGAKVS